MARTVLFGTPVSPGIAIGKVVLTHHAGLIKEEFIAPEKAGAEVSRLHTAVEQVLADLTAARDALGEDMREHREIINAHRMICRDPRLLKDTEERITSQHMCAPWALAQTIKAVCDAFSDIDDPYLRDRAQDIRSVGLRLQCRLAGREFVPRENASPRIHAAEDLSPTDTLDLPSEHILALLMAEGAPTSHTAILARSLRIPAIVGVTGLMHNLRDGDFVIVDALRGCVYVEPNEQEMSVFAQRHEDYVAWEWNVRRAAHLPAETLDAVPVSVQANVERENEVQAASDSGAAGVGLYRTEFTYLRHRHLPDEEQLYNEYAQVAQHMAPQRVVFRTLDVGVDKMHHVQNELKEPNPALGLRGIRFCMRHQNLLRTQLRALMRVGTLGNVSVMVPMVTELEEVQFARRLMNEVAQELATQNIPHAPQLPLGVMIEVPATILIAAELARECDFFSIGTNDLVHYLLAIDRSNKHVAYLHKPLHPSVIRSMKWVIDCAHREGISVSVCGELGADPLFLALLLGLGIDAISATPQAVPVIKHFVRHCHAGQCQDMARAVLMTNTAAAARHLTATTLAQQLTDFLPYHSTLVHGEH